MDFWVYEMNYGSDTELYTQIDAKADKNLSFHTQGRGFNNCVQSRLRSSSNFK